MEILDHVEDLKGNKVDLKKMSGQDVGKLLISQAQGAQPSAESTCDIGAYKQSDLTMFAVLLKENMIDSKGGIKMVPAKRMAFVKEIIDFAWERNFTALTDG